MTKEDAGDRAKTMRALYALGPRAVEILKERLESTGNVGSDQVEAAQEILDRMSIRRASSPA